MDGSLLHERGHLGIRRVGGRTRWTLPVFGFWQGRRSTAEWLIRCGILALAFPSPPGRRHFEVLQSIITEYVIDTNNIQSWPLILTTSHARAWNFASLGDLQTSDRYWDNPGRFLQIQAGWINKYRRFGKWRKSKLPII